jgi:hypothetical protein
MKKLLILLVTLFFMTGIFVQNVIAQPAAVVTTSNVSESSAYATLKAAFDAINGGTHQGEITIKINRSSSELASCVLNASGSGGAYYTSVNIYPTATGITVSGNFETPLIDLNGADNVTIDGRVNGTGDAKSLTISNTSTSATAGTSTIRFIADASTNTVKYCNILGSSTATTGGILFFSTGTTTGNITNTIDHNNISNSLDANRPVNGIYSLGTSGAENSGNTISNNNIYDFLNCGKASNGIFLSSNTTAWAISGNSFYETNNPFVPTAAVSYKVINIDNTTGNNFTVSNNFIGGNLADHSGVFTMDAGSKAYLFTGIYLNVGTSTATSVESNTIQALSITNYAENDGILFFGINITGGNVNVGAAVASTGNTIGSTTGTGSITTINAKNRSYAQTQGILNSSTGTVSIQNNKIGSITSSCLSDESSQHFYGITNSATSGIIAISKNIIGSTGTANSINATSPATWMSGPRVIGISNSGGGTVTISENTVSNISNACTMSGRVNGIWTTAGATTISGNTVRNLSVATSNSNPLDNASMCGILVNCNTSGQTISGNTIYNLSNSHDDFNGSIIGLYYQSTTTSGNISGNFIHSLSVTGANSSGADICGIKTYQSGGTFTNNIIALNVNTASKLNGFFEYGNPATICKMYFNTIYIGGTSPASSAFNSYALYCESSSYNRDISNNIFVNALTNGASATGKHYGVYFNTSRLKLHLQFFH